MLDTQRFLAFLTLSFGWVAAAAAEQHPCVTHQETHAGFRKIEVKNSCPEILTVAITCSTGKTYSMNVGKCGTNWVDVGNACGKSDASYSIEIPMSDKSCIDGPSGRTQHEQPKGAKDLLNKARSKTQGADAMNQRQRGAMEQDQKQTYGEHKHRMQEEIQRNPKNCIDDYVYRQCTSTCRDQSCIDSCTTQLRSQSVEYSNCVPVERRQEAFTPPPCAQYPSYRACAMQCGGAAYERCESCLEQCRTSVSQQLWGDVSRKWCDADLTVRRSDCAVRF